MCKVRHAKRDAFDRPLFDIPSSHFAGKTWNICPLDHYTAGSPKRSSYVAQSMWKRQNKFTNSFYRFTFDREF